MDSEKQKNFIKEILKVRKNEPSRYSYKAFLHEGEKYVQFPTDNIYPLELLKSIVEGIDKTEIGKQTAQIGLILKIPVPKGMIKDSKLKGGVIMKEKKINKPKKSSSKKDGMVTKKKGKKKVSRKI